MNILVLGRYSWLRLARSHYLKVLWSVAFFVGIAALGYFSNPDEMGKAMSVELALKFGRWGAWLVSIWIGMSVLSGELSSHTARTLLTKPISRMETTLGLLLGGMAFVALLILMATAETFIISKARGIPVSPWIFLLQFSLLPPLAAIMALSQLLCLLFARPVAGFFMLGLSFEELWRKLYESMSAGGPAELLKSSLHILPEWMDAPLAAISLVLYGAAPTYDRFVQSYHDFMFVPFPAGLFLFHSFSSFVYVLVCCAACAYLISRKEI
jgi:ABC-type transport system involved in multi-copper enzyme maturation permease subunit